MGTNVGGMILPFSGNELQAVVFIEQLEGKVLYKREHWTSDFNTGSEEYFSFCLVNGYLILHHAYYVHSMFYTPEIWQEKFKQLGLMDRMIIFLRVDSANAVGYAVYENAKQIRCFEQSDGKTYQLGEELSFEQQWLNAPAFYVHEFEDEYGEWQTQNIPESEFNEEKMEEWADYYKCRYLDDYENSVHESGLAGVILNELLFEMFQMEYTLDNLYRETFLYSTLSGPQQSKQSHAKQNSKSSLWRKLTALFNK
ncbi:MULTISPECIES: hypothetical protein [Acinetobacter]|uniref:Uncharacterized protein n=1 Tax=Acinetobacter piscicola TaxID=2006115 RepID=A0A7S6VX34_9GAMM|nr:MULTISPECIES: hypothetical protein [Acinetobacter]QOW46410.1 hypothetical protein G0028_11165 [Acinetobacter piscicola]